MIYLGDFQKNNQVYYQFDTVDASGNSVNPTTSGVAFVYSNNDNSQFTSGVTYDVGFDSITGLHNITVDTTEVAYVNGNDYTVVISGMVLDSRNVNSILSKFSLENRYDQIINNTLITVSGNLNRTEATINALSGNLLRTEGTLITVSGNLLRVDNTLITISGNLLRTESTLNTVSGDLSNGVDIASISGNTDSANNLSLMYNGSGYIDDTAPASRSQLNQIALTGAAVNTPATTYVLASGLQVANTYSDTVQLNDVRHTITDNATGTISFYYEFNIGGDGVPTGVSWTGALTNHNDTIEIFAYNWNTTSWDQIGSHTGTVSSADISNTYTLFTSHVGTGVNIGLVRIKFENQSTIATSATLYTDQIFTSYAIVTRTVGYADGSVWVDTLNGTAGTESHVNGTADKPSLTWADALTIASNLNLTRYSINNGSHIQLTGNSDFYSLEGHGWELDFNGQSCDGTYFNGANMSGSYTNTNNNTQFELCRLNNVSGDPTTASQCQFADIFTMTDVGNYYFNDCISAVAGTSSPEIDCGLTVGDTNLNMRRYAGGILIHNMGASGVDNMSLEGHGQLKIGSSCVSGVIAIRGHFKITDYASGVIDISDLANFVSTIIHADVAQGAGVGNNQIQLSSRASSVDGGYDPSIVFIVTGTGAGQTRMIYQYEGSTRTATVDRNWKVNPDNTSRYRIMADPGREHVNEGLCQTGSTSSTIKLNILASSQDDAYRNQLIFLRGGTGEDQVGVCESYVGSTQTATMHENWNVIPDGTTSYVVLPSHIHEIPVMANIITASGVSAGFDNVADISSLAQQSTLVTVSGDVSNNYSSTLGAIQNIQNNSFISAAIPSVLEIPDTGSDLIPVTVAISNGIGAATNIDGGALPSGTLTNDSGNDLSIRISGGWSNPEIGKYVISYINSSGDTIEGVHWDILATVSGNMYRYPGFTQLVDTTAVDFTAADRSDLQAVKTQTDNLPVDPASETSLTTISGDINNLNDVSIDQIIASGTVAGWDNIADVSTLALQSTLVTISGDIALANAGISATYNKLIVVSGDINNLNDVSINEIVSSGTDAGWATVTTVTTVTVSGITPDALSEITASGEAAGWSTTADLTGISGDINTLSGQMTLNNSIIIAVSGDVYNLQNTVDTVSGNLTNTPVTVSGITPPALSQIVTSGNAASWNGELATVTVSGLTPEALSEIVTSGTAAGWDASATVTTVTVSGLTPEALSEITASGTGATIYELTGDPGANPTMYEAIMLPYMDLRNKRIQEDPTIGSKFYKLHKNDGSVLASGSILDNVTNSTFTKGKLSF